MSKCWFVNDSKAIRGSVSLAAWAGGSRTDYDRYIKRPCKRRDGRVAEGARLESVFRGNSNLGSNPSLSARLLPSQSIHGIIECEDHPKQAAEKGLCNNGTTLQLAEKVK